MGREDTYNCSCLKCGHQWLSRVKEPLSCPSCKNREWGSPRKRKSKMIKEEQLTQEEPIENQSPNNIRRVELE